MTSRARAGLRAGAALLVGGAVLAGCGADRPRARPGAPVVLISIDTLRADRLPAYGYAAGRTPAIDELAARGVVVERAYTPYPLTLPAHASLLSGQLPQHHGVRDNTGFAFEASSHPCLPRQLAAGGYATGAFVSSWMLRRSTGLGSCFDTYDDELESGAPAGSGQRPGAATVARAIAWLRTLEPARPFFLFLHLYEPHAPYSPPEPWASQLADPYDGEVATADAAVGTLLAELRRSGRYDDALVLLVADHGEGLGDHGELRHGVLLYQETVRVPWILKLPHEEWAGRRLPGPAGLIDVAPTVSGILGMPPDPRSDGLSIFSSAGRAGDRSFYVETWYPRLRLGWSELRALVDARYAAIDAPRPELYDLARDPRQKSDLAESERKELATRLQALRALDRPPAAPAPTDEESTKKLAALGYLGGSAPARGDGPLPNPRDRIAELSRFEAALEADAAGDPAKAAAELERLLDENPGMVEALPFLARAQQHLGRIDDAIRTLTRAHAAGDDPSVALGLARLLLQKGDFDAARALGEETRAADPRRAYELLVEVARRTGDAAAAARWTEAAVAQGVATLPVLREKARELAAGGHADDAVRLLEPHADDADAETLAVLGLALADSGRAEDGLTLLTRARSRAPESPAVLESLGVVALRLDRIPLAAEALEAAVRGAPGSASAWNSLGVARYRSGDPPGAVAAWQQATRLEPALADALYNLGLVAADLGRREVAREALRRYLAVATDAAPEDRARAQQLLAQLGG